MGKFELYTDASGEYRFRLKAGNGENILASEGYSSRAGCENGIESVKKNSQEDERFEIMESANGKFYFHLLAGNGQVIGVSQMYASEESAENGIESVMRNALGAEVEEV